METHTHGKGDTFQRFPNLITDSQIVPGCFVVPEEFHQADSRLKRSFDPLSLQNWSLLQNASLTREILHKH